MDFSFLRYPGAHQNYYFISKDKNEWSNVRSSFKSLEKELPINWIEPSTDLLNSTNEMGVVLSGIPYLRKSSEKISNQDSHEFNSLLK